MLILSKKLYETLVIGDNIAITILEIREGEARIGIDAPQGILMTREEGCEKEKFKYKSFFSAFLQWLSQER